MRIEIEGLEDKPDLRPNLGHIGLFVMDLHVVDDELPFLNGFQAVDTANQGAFPRSARTADDYYLPLVDVEIDILEDVKFPKPFIYVS